MLRRLRDSQPASVSVPAPAPIVTGGGLARLCNSTYMYRAEQELARYAETGFEDPAGFGEYLDTPHAFWKEIQSDLPPAGRIISCLTTVSRPHRPSPSVFSARRGSFLSAKKSNLSSSNFFNMLMHSSYEKFRESDTAA